jgi:hypothetical protein
LPDNPQVVGQSLSCAIQNASGIPDLGPQKPDSKVALGFDLLRQVCLPHPPIPRSATIYRSLIFENRKSILSLFEMDST